MKVFKKKTFASFMLVCFALLMFAPSALATYADGEYSVNYTVLKGDNDSASIANDYFGKPAKVIVKDGKAHVQIVFNKSDWTKSLTLDGSAGTVINNDPANDKRTVEFLVSDLSKPVVSKMHIQIPDMDYDNHYTVRFSFDASSIPQASAPATTPSEQQNTTNEAPKQESTNKPAASNNNNATTTTKVEQPKTTNNESTVKTETIKKEKDTADKAEVVNNPKTGDTTNLVMLYTLLAISSVFLVHKIRKTHFSKE